MINKAHFIMQENDNYRWRSELAICRLVELMKRIMGL